MCFTVYCTETMFWLRVKSVENHLHDSRHSVTWISGISLPIFQVYNFCTCFIFESYCVVVEIGFSKLYTNMCVIFLSFFNCWRISKKNSVISVFVYFSSITPLIYLNRHFVNIVIWKQNCTWNLNMERICLGTGLRTFKALWRSK